MKHLTKNAQFVDGPVLPELPQKLRIVQNCAAGITSGCHKCKHITPVLQAF